MDKTEYLAWEKFKKTGSVEDYLTYRMVVGYQRKTPYDTAEQSPMEQYPTAGQNTPPIT